MYPCPFYGADERYVRIKSGKGHICNKIFSGSACAMAHPLRIEFPGALYHVTSRGNARQIIFRDDEDREMFLELEIGVRLCYFDNLRAGMCENDAYSLFLLYAAVD